MAKILVIEDDSVMLKMYARVFGYEGFEIATASNGVDGLDQAKTAKPDLILLDIMLPKMSGLQVLDQLKTNPDTQNIPVVVFSNLAGKQDRDAVLAKGAIRYISKSQVTPKQVAQVVREELQRLNLNGSTPSPPPTSTPPTPTPPTSSSPPTQ